jgi:hypothetical protein
MLFTRPYYTLALIGLSLATPQTAAAQGDEAAILMTIDRLFEGMGTADTIMVKSVFHPEGRLVTIDERENQQQTRVTPLKEFLGGIAQSGGDWAERYWSPVLRIDGELAAVWAEYDFHLAGAFSHCGTDAFHLIRTESGWRILNVAYTKRTESCEGPPGG